MNDKDFNYLDFGDESDDEFYDDDSNEIELSAQAESVLDNVNDLGFSNMFAALSTYDKVSVSSFAEDMYSQLSDEEKKKYDQDELDIIDLNIDISRKSILDDLFRFKDDEKFWIIVNPVNCMPMYFPYIWTDYGKEFNPNDCGLIAMLDYDSAEEITEYLNANGIECSFTEMYFPYAFVRHYINEMGASWICITNDPNTFVHIDETDIMNENSDLSRLLNLYSQKTVQNDEIAKENTLRELVKELRYSLLICPVKISKKRGELRPIPEFCLFKIENENGDDNILPCYTDLSILESAPIPFDYAIARYPASFLLELSEKSEVPIKINPFYADFSLPDNINDIISEVNSSEDFKDMLGDIMREIGEIDKNKKQNKK